MTKSLSSAETLAIVHSQHDEIEELRGQLAEAEETLLAIRRGEVDAVVVKGAAGPQVYTLLNADRPYRNIVERMHEGALTLAPDGTILYANQSLATCLGLALPHIIGQKLARFITPDDQVIFSELLAKAGAGGGRAELALVPLDGKPVPVHLSMVDLQDEDKIITSGIVTDLSCQKQRMQELAKANASLSDAISQQKCAETKLRQAQKMEAVGQLTAGIAHDFNNLLMVLSGNLELFKSRVNNEWMMQRVEASLRAVERGGRLTEQLMAFGRVQNLQPHSISVNALLRDIEPLLSAAVGAGITLKFELDDKISQSLVDASELQATILNLTINAKDAMPTGGSLTITTEEIELCARPDGEAEAIQGGRYLLIAVTDTGHGMPSEIRERAFDPFFTTKDFGKGTGLGLSRVYGFMRQSGGLAAIEGAAGAGTTVHLYIPATDISTATREPEAVVQLSHKAPQTGRVLVVEDDHSLRTVVVDVLESLGYAVISAESGPAALSLLDHGTEVDVIFSDVLMPDGMSGFQLAHEVQRRQPRRAIVLTSRMSGDTGIAEKSTQSLQILPKPYKFEALSEAVAAAVAAVSKGQP